MRKWCLALAALMLLTALLTGCGNVRNVEMKIGPSELYGRGELRQATDLILRQFRGFEGCTLLELEYDEERSREVSKSWAQQYQADEAIVLYSVFYVDESGVNPSLNPGQTYRNWSWVLTRSHGGNWKLQTWGYG